MGIDGRSDLQGQSVLIVSIHYSPEETGIAPYTTGLAEHLAKQGNDVTVLTAMPFYPNWRVYDGYRRLLWLSELRNEVDVRRLRHYVPARQSALRRALYEISFLPHGARLVTLSRPDIVIGVMPSVSGGAIAAAAAKRFSAPLGLVIQDLSGPAASQTGIKGGKLAAKLTRSTEGWIIRQADRIAIVAEGFRPYLEELGIPGDRIERIRNWTHIGKPTHDREATRSRLGIPTESIVCLHAGNMGLKQGLENVIDAAKLALNRGAPALHFILVGDGNQRSHLQALALRLPNVRFMSPQTEEDFPDVLAAADVLLVNQRPTVTDMCLPGKLTSYLSIGRPVIAAVASGSETAQELEAAGAGMVINAGKPEELLAAIDRIISNPVLAKELSRRGQAFAKDALSEEAALNALQGFVASLARSRSKEAYQV